MPNTASSLRRLINSASLTLSTLCGTKPAACNAGLAALAPATAAATNELVGLDDVLAPFEDRRGPNIDTGATGRGVLDPWAEVDRDPKNAKAP